jgi:antitoxin component of RelBE/YafQ-DinJ toxin-antitoxin module
MSTLLQFRIEDEIKASLEAVFGLDGLSPAQGMKVLAYQIARSGRSPLANTFNNVPNEPTRRAIAEARRLEDHRSADHRKRYASARDMAADILGEDL